MRSTAVVSIGATLILVLAACDAGPAASDGGASSSPPAASASSAAQASASTGPETSPAASASASASADGIAGADLVGRRDRQRLFRAPESGRERADRDDRVPGPPGDDPRGARRSADPQSPVVPCRGVPVCRRRPGGRGRGGRRGAGWVRPDGGPVRRCLGQPRRTDEWGRDHPDARRRRRVHGRALRADHPVDRRLDRGGGGRGLGGHARREVDLRLQPAREPVDLPLPQGRPPVRDLAQGRRRSPRRSSQRCPSRAFERLRRWRRPGALAGTVVRPP